MYDVEWAKHFQGFTKDNPMDLHKFAQFYEANIAKYRFEYTTKHKRVPIFVIESEGSQLPHLMGLQKWNNLSTTQAALQYEYMLKGDWTLEMLKSADDGAWQEWRERIEFTPFLYTLLHECKCTVKLVNQNVRGSGFVGRQITMFFQKEHGKLTFALELREIKGKGVYRPTSITTHRKNSPALREPHTPIQITSVKINKI